jgi:hypothetical protein
VMVAFEVSGGCPWSGCTKKPLSAGDGVRVPRLTWLSWVHLLGAKPNEAGRDAMFQAD